MSDRLSDVGLDFNPFEPSASGAPVSSEDLWLPKRWRTELKNRLDMLEQAQGVRAIAISGEYGSGKSYILRWLEREELPARRIRPFFFDNPGVQFYDLANALLREIGRKDFAKLLWELARDHVRWEQRSLFADGFEEYLRAHSRRKAPDIANDLQDAIKAANIAQDDEISYRLARIVTDIPKKPYFEYRDFVAGRRDSLVSEGEEAPYFAAVLRTLREGGGISAVAFLIDEFEEVSLEKRLTRRATHDYLATLKRLINLTQEGHFWLIVTMTPEAVEKTRELEPPLWERFTADGEYLYEIPELNTREAMQLVRHRLNAARSEDRELHPFPRNLGKLLSEACISSPRRLVKVCFYALSDPERGTAPFTPEYVRSIERKAYPPPEGEDDA